MQLHRFVVGKVSRAFCHKVEKTRAHVKITALSIQFRRQYKLVTIKSSSSNRHVWLKDVAVTSSPGTSCVPLLPLLQPRGTPEPFPVSGRLARLRSDVDRWPFRTRPRPESPVRRCCHTGARTLNGMLSSSPSDQSVRPGQAELGLASPCWKRSAQNRVRGGPERVARSNLCKMFDLNTCLDSFNLIHRRRSSNTKEHRALQVICSGM
jgi:hypothetical protein